MNASGAEASQCKATARVIVSQWTGPRRYDVEEEENYELTLPEDEDFTNGSDRGNMLSTGNARIDRALEMERAGASIKEIFDETGLL